MSKTKYIILTLALFFTIGYSTTQNSPVKDNNDVIISADDNNNDTDKYIALKVGQSTKVIIHDDGFVGVGTTDPQAKLTVKEDYEDNYGGLLLEGDRPSIRFDSENGPSNNQKWLQHIDSSGDFNFYTSTNGTSWILSKMKITTDGKVALSEANPKARLDIGDGGIAFGCIDDPEAEVGKFIIYCDGQHMWVVKKMNGQNWRSRITWNVWATY